MNAGLNWALELDLLAKGGLLGSRDAAQSHVERTANEWGNNETEKGENKARSFRTIY